MICLRPRPSFLTPSLHLSTQLARATCGLGPGGGCALAQRGPIKPEPELNFLPEDLRPWHGCFSIPPPPPPTPRALREPRCLPAPHWYPRPVPDPLKGALAEPPACLPPEPAACPSPPSGHHRAGSRHLPTRARPHDPCCSGSARPLATHVAASHGVSPDQVTAPQKSEGGHWSQPRRDDAQGGRTTRGGARASVSMETRQ